MAVPIRSGDPGSRPAPTVDRGFVMRAGHRGFGLLVPLLLSGCGAFSGSAPADSSTAGAGADGESWTVVAEGRPTPSPSIGAGPAPSASPTVTRAAARPLPPPPPAPGPTCTGAIRRAGYLDGLTVVPGPGTATVTWVHTGGAEVVAYRLTAIAQRLERGYQRDVGWQTIVPAQPCAPLSATISGLDRAAPYTFSLDAVVSRRNTDAPAASTVARSQVLYTT